MPSGIYKRKARGPYKLACELKSKYRQVKVGDKAEYEHRLIMETLLGRSLKCNEHVHHINGDCKDNRISNLQIMEASEHNREHMLDGRAKFMSQKGHVARWGC